jgi:thiamine-monophosphate kinase
VSTLRDIGEDALIARLTLLVPLDPQPSAGPGDDCAVIDPGPLCDSLELLKTDAMVAGIHFLHDTPPRAVGWKCAARVVSDFAAMGGKPERFLVTLALPVETRISWVEEVYRGIGDCLKSFGAVMAGGETSRVPTGSAAVLSIAATGSVRREHLILRSTARPGQVLLVTGVLGGSLSGKHLAFMPRIREAQWLAAHFKPAAMMDLSDGLAKDLPRMAEASACGFRLDRENLPLSPGSSVEQALNDGEDFELLLAMDAERVPALLAAWPITFPGLPLNPIGRLVTSHEGEKLTGGWDHFSTSSPARSQS